MSDLSQVVAVLCGSCTAPPSNFLSLNCLASEEELTSVCSALKTSNFTGGLRLGVSCNVGDRGAAALATALTVNQALESLELPDNGITAAGVRALVGALQINRSLLDVDLSDNPCEVEAPEEMSRLIYALRRNRLAHAGSHRTPEPVHASYNDCTPSWAQSAQRFYTPASTAPSQPSNMLRKSVCIQEMPAETPAGLAYRLRERGNQVSQSMCWEVTGKSKTKENVEPTAYLNPIDVEYRLQACEDTQAVMAEDLENLRGFGSDLSTWRNQMEEASSQVATVLNLVESDTSDFRSHLSALQEEVATVKRQQPSLSALPEGPPLLRLDQIIEELEILSTRQTQSDKTFQATAHDLTFCLQRLEAGMEEMKVSLACQADSIASLQFQNEEHHTARMEQNARMACLEDTLQQLQASVRRTAPKDMHVRVDAGGSHAANAWSLSHVIMYPIATAARWLMNASA